MRDYVNKDASVPCLCGHWAAVHNIGVRRGEKVRTACSVMDARGQCDCTGFREQP